MAGKPATQNDGHAAEPERCSFADRPASATRQPHASQQPTIRSIADQTKQQQISNGQCPCDQQAECSDHCMPLHAGRKRSGSSLPRSAALPNKRRAVAAGYASFRQQLQQSTPSELGQGYQYQASCSGDSLRIQPCNQTHGHDQHSSEVAKDANSHIPAAMEQAAVEVSPMHGHAIQNHHHHQQQQPLPPVIRPGTTTLIRHRSEQAAEGQSHCLRDESATGNASTGDSDAFHLLKATHSSDDQLDLVLTMGGARKAALPSDTIVQEQHTHHHHQQQHQERKAPHTAHQRTIGIPSCNAEASTSGFSLFSSMSLFDELIDKECHAPQQQPKPTVHSKLVVKKSTTGQQQQQRMNRDDQTAVLQDALQPHQHSAMLETTETRQQHAEQAPAECSINISRGLAQGCPSTLKQPTHDPTPPAMHYPMTADRASQKPASAHVALSKQTQSSQDTHRHQGRTHTPEDQFSAAVQSAHTTSNAISKHAWGKGSNLDTRLTGSPSNTCTLQGLIDLAVLQSDIQGAGSSSHSLVVGAGQQQFDMHGLRNTAQNGQQSTAHTGSQLDTSMAERRCKMPSAHQQPSTNQLQQDRVLTRTDNTSTAFSRGKPQHASDRPRSASKPAAASMPGFDQYSFQKVHEPDHSSKGVCMTSKAEWT